jgi:hypothetical protein
MASTHRPSRSPRGRDRFSVELLLGARQNRENRLLRYAEALGDLLHRTAVAINRPGHQVEHAALSRGETWIARLGVAPPDHAHRL